MHRKTHGYVPRPDRNTEVRARLRQLAEKYPRYGGSMLYLMVRREGFVVNHKRFDRLYRLEGLKMRLRGRRKRARHLRVALPPPERPDETWSMDFIHDALATARPFKCLTVVDNLTRQAPAIRVAHSIRGRDVVEALERLRLRGRKPKRIVVDNGPEFRSRALGLWALRHGVELCFIDPGKPVQNAFIESFNARFRAECLSAQWFGSLEQARLFIEVWRKEYENERPHGSLNGKTPNEFAETFGIGVPNISPALSLSVAT
jgi:putative transposase